MPPFHSRSTGALSTVDTSWFGVIGPVRRAEHGTRLRAQLDRLQRPRVHATAGGDARRVVVRPARAGQLEQPLALGEGHLRVGVRIDEDVAVVERGDEAQLPRPQHAVAEHVAGHVTDADGGERIGLGVLAEHAGVTADALPRATRRDAHRLVVVPGAPAGGERVAEPEAVLVGDLVGDVAERRRALVGGDDEVGVVAVVDDRVRRVDDLRRSAALGRDEVVGQVEQAGDERPVAVDDLGPQARRGSPAGA